MTEVGVTDSAARGSAVRVDVVEQTRRRRLPCSMSDI
jgi:hypothetical protein